MYFTISPASLILDFFFVDLAEARLESRSSNGGFGAVYHYVSSSRKYKFNKYVVLQYLLLLIT